MQTIVEEIPSAICPYQGRVVIGVGRLLRVYDLGKKKLLRKCENKVCLDKRIIENECLCMRKEINVILRFLRFIIFYNANYFIAI